MKYYDTIHFHRRTEFVFYQQEELVRLCIMEKETEIRALVWINLGIIKLLLTGDPVFRLYIASAIIWGYLMVLSPVTEIQLHATGNIRWHPKNSNFISIQTEIDFKSILHLIPFTGIAVVDLIQVDSYIILNIWYVHKHIMNRKKYLKMNP